MINAEEKKEAEDKNMNNMKSSEDVLNAPSRLPSLSNHMRTSSLSLEYDMNAGLLNTDFPNAFEISNLMSGASNMNAAGHSGSSGNLHNAGGGGGGMINPQIPNLGNDMNPFSPLGGGLLVRSVANPFQTMDPHRSW